MLCHHCEKSFAVSSRIQTLPCGHKGYVEKNTDIKTCSFCSKIFNILSCGHFEAVHVKEYVAQDFNCVNCRRATGHAYFGHLYEATKKYATCYCDTCKRDY